MIPFNNPKSIYLKYKKEINTNISKVLNSGQYVKSNELNNYDIKADVFGRAKHYYSIFNKMNNQILAFKELYDLLAVRIVVD